MSAVSAWPVAFLDFQGDRACAERIDAEGQERGLGVDRARVEAPVLPEVVGHDAEDPLR